MKKLLRPLLRPLGYELKRIGDDAIHRIPEATRAQRAMIETASRYSMTGPSRQWAVMQAVEHVATKRIDGDFVECGVWKGGNLILFGLMAKASGISRRIWGYDTFEGMSEPTDLDRTLNKNAPARAKWERRQHDGFNDWCYAPLDEVKENYAKEVGDDNLVLVKGKVEETLSDPANLPDRISVLRLDTDWYESTRKELEVLYPLLSPGGVLILDDYGRWAGAKQATDEYFAGKPLWMHRVDPECRLAIKD